MNHAGPNGQHNSCTRQQHIARGYTQQHTSLASAQHTPSTQLLRNATQHPHLGSHTFNGTQPENGPASTPASIIHPAPVSCTSFAYVQSGAVQDSGAAVRMECSTASAFSTTTTTMLSVSYCLFSYLQKISWLYYYCDLCA